MTRRRPPKASWNHPANHGIVEPMDTQLHDRGYRRLFEDPYFLGQLLTTFVKEPWVDGLDLATLERLDATFIDPRLVRSEADMIFRTHLGGREAYLVILLEFQSRPDRFMAVRALQYQCSIWLSLLARNPDLRVLPAVLPLVLYTGDSAWDAPLQLAELIESAPAGFEAYLPRFTYRLVDQGSYEPSTLLGLRNLVSALFLLEHTHRQELEPHFATIRGWLRTACDESPESASRFSQWVKVRFAVRNRRADEISADDIRIPEDPMTILDQTIKQLHDEYRQAHQDGHKEGHKEGHKDAQLEVAAKALAKGLSVSEVAELTGLSIDEVRTLAH
jgi:hypothetical protein